jgi:hypothetical protein
LTWAPAKICTRVSEWVARLSSRQLPVECADDSGSTKLYGCQAYLVEIDAWSVKQFWSTLANVQRSRQRRELSKLRVYHFKTFELALGEEKSVVLFGLSAREKKHQTVRHHKIPGIRFKKIIIIRYRGDQTHLKGDEYVRIKLPELYYSKGISIFVPSGR